MPHQTASAARLTRHDPVEQYLGLFAHLIYLVHRPEGFRPNAATPVSAIPHEDRIARREGGNDVVESAVAQIKFIIDGKSDGQGQSFLKTVVG